MHKDQMPAMTRDVIESGHKAARNVIAAGRGGTTRVLRACDRTWHSGAAMIAAEPALISQSLKDDLISLQGQLTLNARYLVDSAADRGECIVDGVAQATASTVSEYERVFDLRVAQAMSRLGMPVAGAIRALASHAADLSVELAQPIAVHGEQASGRNARHAKKTSKNGTRKPVRRSKRAKAA